MSTVTKKTGIENKARESTYSNASAFSKNPNLLRTHMNTTGFKVGKALGEITSGVDELGVCSLERCQKTSAQWRLEQVTDWKESI